MPSPVSNTSRYGDLVVEVVSAEDLTVSDYRMGDVAGAILGLRKLRPYMCITAPSVSGKIDQGSWEGETWWTSIVDADDEGYAEFWERCCFQMTHAKWGGSLVGTVFKVTVYDHRGMPSLVRGDPLIGEGTFELNDEVFGGICEQSVPIRSRKGEFRGYVSLRARLRAPSMAVDTLAGGTRDSSLAKVACALAQVAAQPESVEVLLHARPDVLKIQLAAEEDEIRHMFRDWVVRFCKQAGEFSGEECDHEVIYHLAMLARAVQDIVASCVWWEDSRVDVESLTVAWIQRFLAACTGGSESTVALDQVRLRRLLRAHRTSDGDPRKALRNMGAKTLPAAMSSEVALAIWLRALEAKTSNEEEVLTRGPLVENGKLVPGLAMVLRWEPEHKRPHVFFYDEESLRRWQERTHADPFRVPLESRDIHSLS